MLECHDYLAWMVDTLEKIKPTDDITLRFMLPYVMQVKTEMFRNCSHQVVACEKFGIKEGEGYLHFDPTFKDAHSEALMQ